MALILMCKFNYAYNYIVFMHYLLYFSRNLFSFSQYKNIKKNVPWHNFLSYKKAEAVTQNSLCTASALNILLLCLLLQSTLACEDLSQSLLDRLNRGSESP